MQVCQTCESIWRETPCISTVDLSCTHVADLPAGVLLCPECPHQCVLVFTSETARQAHRARAHGHRAMARDFVSDEQCPACGKVFGSRPMAIEHLQCRAQRCRRKMLDGLLSRPSAAVIAAADEHDRVSEDSIAKCSTDRLSHWDEHWELLLAPHSINVSNWYTTLVAPLLVAEGLGLSGCASQSSTLLRCGVLKPHFDFVNAS